MRGVDKTQIFERLLFVDMEIGVSHRESWVVAYITVYMEFGEANLIPTSINHKTRFSVSPSLSLSPLLISIQTFNDWTMEGAVWIGVACGK